MGGGMRHGGRTEAQAVVQEKKFLARSKLTQNHFPPFLTHALVTCQISFLFMTLETL